MSGPRNSLGRTARTMPPPTADDRAWAVRGLERRNATDLLPMLGLAEPELVPALGVRVIDGRGYCRCCGKQASIERGCQREACDAKARGAS